MTIDNYIETIYKELADSYDIEFIDLYQSFSTKKLQEIFATLHSILVKNYEAMNVRLPTNKGTADYWAENSRALLAAIDRIDNLERTLSKTIDAFHVDDYYKETLKNSASFLSPNWGSIIPEGTQRIKIYYTEPIFIRNNSIAISSGFNSNQYYELKYKTHGSYADVYEYNDSFYNRKFILKRAKENLNDKELERFKQEYEQMSQLHSPYVVEVYNYNEERNEYIMEYMDGTLADYILNSNPKPTRKERIYIVNQVLRAFKYIHSKGLLHRDISPSNILLKKYNDAIIIKIADFGLVKVPDSTLTSYSTKPKGRFIDPALDSEGYANYSIEDETFVLTKVVSYIMTGSAWIISDIDEKLKKFLQKGISSDKTERYHSVDEMIKALKKVFSNEQ